MAWILDKARVLIGVQEAPSAVEEKGELRRRPAKSSAELQEDNQVFLQTERLKIRKLEHKVGVLNKEIGIHIQKGEKSEASAKMYERNTLALQIQQKKAKLTTLEQTSEAVSTAETDLTQAELMQHGSAQLGEIVRETQRIDLDRVVDDLQDHMQVSDDFGRRLAEPLRGYDYGQESVEGMSVDEEVAMLMQRAADEKAAQLPEGASGGSGNNNGRPVLLDPPQADREEQKTKIKKTT